MCAKKSIQLSIVKLAIFAILQLAPILIIIDINNRIVDLPMILNLILYCIMFVINTILANTLISLMEKVPVFRKVLQISYTKKYRRNIATGFNIE